MHTPPFGFFVCIHWFIVLTALFPTPSLSHMLSPISLLSYTSAVIIRWIILFAFGEWVGTLLR